jgi:peptidoglycan/xylan/chitin deacetylase (PgdA/CDA1 family)
MRSDFILKITVLFFSFVCIAYAFTLYSDKSLEHKSFEPDGPVIWPEGYRMALSLSFDDAQQSQIDIGLPIFKKYDAHATFYVLPSKVKNNIKGWEHVVKDGHEIGNHTLYHPCTANFTGIPAENSIENYTLERMSEELDEANRQIEELLEVTPKSFAYSCGHTFVGRGINNKSYIPLVANTFVSGRGWLGEAPNDPYKVDLANVLGTKMDDKAFQDILPVLHDAQKHGKWVVLAGHNIGEAGAYVTRASMLDDLLAYARDPKNGIWLAPVGDVAEYIRDHRQDGGVDGSAD